MYEKKNVDIASNESNNDINNHIYTFSDEAQNPDGYLEEYMHNDEYYDSKCISCVHWSGDICNARLGICDYESILKFY